MTGTYFIRCPRCGKRWSVSGQRNTENEFVCPECAERQKRILRHNKPIDYDRYQVIAVDLHGLTTYGGAYAANKT